MEVEKKAKRDFKQLNDFLEKAYKTANYEFTWHYEGITIEYNNYQNQGLSVDLGASHQFNELSIGEVELVLRSLLMIYDLNNRGLIKVIKINTWTKTTMQYNNIHSYLKDWREYNGNESFNWLGERTIENIDVNGVLNCLLITLSQVRYTEGEYWTRKTMEEDNNMRFDNISEFYDKWFVAHQGFVSDEDEYSVKLVRDNTEYLQIRAYKAECVNQSYIRVLLYNPLDFNVTPDEFSKLLFMLSVIYSWHDDYTYKVVVDNVQMGTLDFLYESIDQVVGKEYRIIFYAYYNTVKDELLTKNEASQWFTKLLDTWERMTHVLAEQAEQTEDDTEMKDLSTDNVRIFNNVGDFCAAFYSQELTFVSNAENFKIMLFSKDKHTKYISIAGYNGSQVNVTFHETTFVIELVEVMNIVRVMRRLLLASYHTGEYGVDFNYKSYPDDMLSYVKFLLGNTPKKYVECFDKYEELEQEELEQNGKYLYELYEKAYVFLGKWLDFAEKWQEQHDSESNSHNYYTDDKGQDMFAKFESLDDFREQTYALGFCYHNIEKYLVRAGRKTDDPTEDINKALDYLHEYRKLQKIYFE